MLYELIFKLVNSQIYIRLAMILVAGFLFGYVAKKVRLPKITGYILVGILLGPSVFNIFTPEAVEQLDFIPYISLGLIAVLIGGSLSFEIFKHLKQQLLLISIFEAFGAFIVVLVGMYFVGLEPGVFLPLAAISCATAPAAVIAVVREYKSFGNLTNMLLGVVALDDAVALIIFGFVLSFDVYYLSHFGTGVWAVFYLFMFEIFNSFIIGGLLALIAHLIIHRIRGKVDDVIVFMSMIFLGMGLSQILHLSHLLTNMFLGMAFVNFSRQNKIILEEIEKFTPIIFCMFFVLAGVHLNFNVFFDFGYLMFLWAGALIVFRILGKIIGVYIGATISNAPRLIKNYLGISLIPQAGVAIGLTMLIQEGSYYYTYRPIIINLTLAAVAINEIIGPIATKFALIRAEEAIVLPKNDELLLDEE